MTAMDKENFLLCVCMCMRNRRDSVLLHCLFLNLRLYWDRWDVFDVNVKPLDDTIYCYGSLLRYIHATRWIVAFLPIVRLGDKSNCICPPNSHSA